MIRLIEKNINTEIEYNRIYKVRKNKTDDWDQKRWDQLLKYYKGGRLVDLGCLDSLIPQMAKDRHPRSEVWGFDHAGEAIEDMQQKFPKILYHIGDLYDTRFNTGYFDYVVLGEVLEHMDDPMRVIKEALRVLRHRGTLAISVPYNEAREPGAVDADRHIWSFTEDDFKDLPNVEIEILYSKKEYHYPNILVWAKKR